MKILKMASICEGIAERDMEALYNSAPVRHFRQGEHHLAAAEGGGSQRTQNAQIAGAEFMQQFIKQIPKLPANVTQLSQKLMADSTSIHEIVESIKRDPALAANVLKCVNSARYSFNKKIETFHH